MNGLSFQDWECLLHAFSAYRELGYQSLQVPWHASPEAVQITLPPDTSPSIVATKQTSLILVGSAEQIFLELALRDAIPWGHPIVGLTPCFRLDDYGEHHHPYFAKVELGCFWNMKGSVPTQPELVEEAQTLRDHARSVHHAVVGVLPQLGPPSANLVEMRGRGFLREFPLEDLEIDGLEVGSYGVRYWESESHDVQIAWVYGTGMAAPRVLEAVQERRKIPPPLLSRTQS